MNSKIAKAINAIMKQRTTTAQYQVMLKIARSPLPKKKQEKYDNLATQAQVKAINAAQARDAAVRKLTKDEQEELLHTIGWA